MRFYRASPRVRLFAGFVTTGTGALVILGTLVLIRVEDAARQDLESRLRCQSTMLGQLSANVLVGPLDDGNESFAESLRALVATTRTGYSLISASGVVVADPSSESPATEPSQLNQPEIVLAAHDGVGVAERDGMIYVATAIAPDGVTLGYARASQPLSRVPAEFQELRTRITAGSLIAVLASVMLAWLLSKLLVRPIAGLSTGVLAEAQASAKTMNHEIPTPTTARVDPAELRFQPEPPVAAGVPSAATDGVELSPCSIATVIADIESLMRVRAGDKQISLLISGDTPIPTSITSDATTLRQILVDLVDNAITLMDAGAVSLRVSFDVDAPRTRRLKLAVSDTGAGMTAEQLGQIVPHVAASAALLGGDVEVDSRPGVGTVFTVLLPTGVRSEEMCMILAGDSGN